MDERRLQIFHTVAQLRNFTRAAEVLHLAQPTVSQQIQLLEAELGVRLLDRTNKSVNLTPSGQSLLLRVPELLRQFNEARRAVGQAAGIIAGPISIGASLTIGQYVIPRALTAFIQRYPGVQVRTATDNTERIAALMLAGALDLGLVEGPVTSPDLVQEPIMDDELVVIAPADHPWRQKAAISLGDFRAERHVVREKGSGTREVMEQHLVAAGLNPADLVVAAELDGIETIKGAVEAGLGVAVVSRWTIRKELQLGTLLAHTIRRVPMKRTFHAIYPRGRTLLPAGAALLELLHTVTRECKGDLSP